MNACTVLPHAAGLFSLVNKVITCLEIYDHVAVDWSGGTLYTPPGVDLWGELFEPLPLPPGVFNPGDDTLAQIVTYPHQGYTYKAAGWLYETGAAWRYRLQKLWRRLEPRQHILNAAQELINPAAVGVMVRALTHAGEQTSNASQSLEAYARALEQWADAHAAAPEVFVMAGDHATVEWFRSRFPIRCNWVTRRAPTRAADFHLTQPQTLQDAANCLVEVLAVSRCRALIHPVSNMATSALYINPNMESIYLP